MVAESAGPGAVGQIFQEQEVPVSILDRPDAPLLYRDFLGLYRRAADATGQPGIGLQVALSSALAILVYSDGMCLKLRHSETPGAH